MHGERRRGDASCKRTVKLIQNCQAFYTAKENCGKSPEELNLHQSQSHLPRAKEDLTAKEKRKQRIARSAIYVSQKKKKEMSDFSEFQNSTKLWRVLLWKSLKMRIVSWIFDYLFAGYNLMTLFSRQPKKPAVCTVNLWVLMYSFFRCFILAWGYYQQCDGLYHKFVILDGSRKVNYFWRKKNNGICFWYTVLFGYK